MPKQKDPSKKYREPLVITNYGENRRKGSTFLLCEMKRHHASGLALQCMKNELDRLADITAKARAKRWSK